MVDHITQNEGTREFIFTGKDGERLIVSNSQLMIENSKEIFLRV